MRLEHVRSHVLNPGNEIADWLADRGAGDQRTSIQHARAWATRMLRTAGGLRAAATPRHGDTGCGDTCERSARGRLRRSEEGEVRKGARGTP